MILTTSQMKTKLDINDNLSDNLLSLLLDQAKDAVLKYVYGSAYIIPSDFVFPETYSYITLDIAIYFYNKLGVEGQSSHKEQGVDRSYGSSNVPPEMFNGLLRKVRTFNL